MREQPTQPNQEYHKHLLKRLTRVYATIWGKLCAIRQKTDQLQITKEDTKISAVSAHGYIEANLTTDHTETFLKLEFVEAYTIPANNQITIVITIPQIYDELCVIVIQYSYGKLIQKTETLTYLPTQDDTQSIYQDHLEPMIEIVQEFIDHEGQDLGYSFAAESSYLDLSPLPSRPPESDNQS